MSGEEPNVLLAVPLYGVKDIQRSLHFYVDGLGFKKTNEWKPEGRLRWCWLELDKVALMLQEFWTDGNHANVPREKLGVGVSMNFTCRDALAVYHQIIARGLTPKQPFVGNGMWVTSIADPDGYHLHFQSPTDVPEETVLE